MNRLFVTLASIACAALSSNIAQAQTRPLTDAHVHYSHDAWDIYPPKKAIAILREARLKRVFVSSSSDDGTQMLYAEAPDLVVPVLRPYARRGEIGTWMHDPDSLKRVTERLKKYKYAGIG